MTRHFLPLLLQETTQPLHEDFAFGGGQRLGDFRPFVFGAYSAVFVLLALFCLRLYLRHRSLTQDLDALRERIEFRRREPEQSVRISPGPKGEDDPRGGRH
jgi:hypothetical protein